MSLERLDLTTFQAGLNLRAGEFQLQDGESPDMLNVEVDPVSGFFVRPGWVRWNDADVEDPTTWDPRHSAQTSLASGLYQVYVSSSDTVYVAGPDGAFSDLAVPCNAPPHLADFAFWGDTAYIATGADAATIGGAPTRRAGTSGPVQLADASTGFNDDYTTPLGGRMPFASYTETHAGYLFVGDLVETSGSHPNRIRWSHPNEPEDWATDDYIDINLGGGRITGIKSFQDHLLIFKADSIWALYGYDLASWQLVQISRSVGSPTTTAIGRNEGAVFFFSGTAGTGIFTYDGTGVREISDALTPAMDEIVDQDDVWVGWVDRRLWVSTPWRPGDSERIQTGAFVWDPSMGGQAGSWVYHEPALGEVRCIVQHSDTRGEAPLVVLAGDNISAFVRVPAHHGVIRVAQDEILATRELTSYENHYRTRWLHMDWPERLKSWLRPRFVSRRMQQEVALRLDVYKDYDKNLPVRSTEGTVSPNSDSITWRELGFDDPLPNGFDFSELGAADPSGRGADFAETPQAGSSIGRALSGFGPARAVQLKFSNATGDPDAGRPWAIDGLFFKVRYRRFTT